MESIALGVDIGGVILDAYDNGKDPDFFLNDFLKVTAVDGSFDALKRLVCEKFDRRVYLVSKCTEQVEKNLWQWFGHRHFFAHSFVRPDHIFFCRAPEEKAAICARQRLTHFIDDRLSVLAHLEAVPNLSLFRHRPEENKGFEHFLPRVAIVNSWAEVLSLLLAT